MAGHTIWIAHHLLQLLEIQQERGENIFISTKLFHLFWHHMAETKWNATAYAWPIFVSLKVKMLLKKMESGGRPGFGTAAAKPALSIVVFPHSVTEIFWSLASL